MASVGFQRLISTSTRGAPRLLPNISVSAVTASRAALVRYNSTAASAPANGSKSETPAVTNNGTNNGGRPVDTPLPDSTASDGTTDWSKSYAGLSAAPFPKEIADVLLAPIDPLDVEIKPGESPSLNVDAFLVLVCLCYWSYFRWFALLTRNQIPPSPQSCFWTWRLGTCTS